MTRDERHYIYMIENTVNYKLYIGMTSSTPKDRFKQHKYEAKKGSKNYHLYNAMNKYGCNNFDLIVLDSCSTFKEAQKLESMYISRFNTFKGVGYNQTNGGEGGKMSKKVRNKISETQSGVKKSDEFKNNLSKTLSGRTFSEKSKAKMSKAHRGEKTILQN